MYILIYTPTFFPRIGGMETVAENLASQFTKLGHKVLLVTPVENTEKDNFNFPVIRTTSVSRRYKLAKKADIIFSNGASLGMPFFAWFARKPFLWRHAGYQVSCIDGLGWAYNKPAPHTPFKSLIFHLKNSSPIYALKGFGTLLLRRFVASNIAKANVGITDWVKNRLNLKNDIRIYNPFPISRFKNNQEENSWEYDFVYLGRLVSEKGVDNLVEALKVLNERSHKEHKLLIIGNGPEKERLINLAAKLDISPLVEFAGRRTGHELSEYVRKGKIGVVPSIWEEPMGGVAVELLASGRPVIVSEYGGLAECAGEAGYTFKNGNVEDLATRMSEAIEDSNYLKLKEEIPGQLEKFREEELIAQYIELFNRFVQ